MTTVFFGSECNYRISENTDISTVYWQSARGIYSKAYRVVSSAFSSVFAANLLLNFTAELDILCLKGADRYAEH